MHSRSKADHGDAAHDRNDGVVHSIHHSHPSVPHVSVPVNSNDRSSPHRRQLRLILSIAIFVSVVVTTLTYFQIQANAKAATKHSSVSLSAQIEQYNRLVVRAQELVRQYKSLSRSSSLPPELTFQFANNPSPSSSVSANGAAPTVVTKKLRNKSKKRGEFGQRTSYPSNPRDLVLGMAHDVDEKNLAVFIKSLRNVSSANCILFVRAPVSSRVQDLGYNHKVKLITSGKDKYPENMANFHPSTLRWELFRSFFTDHEGYKMIYNRVFLLDVRDTFFQHDPFTFFAPELSSLHVFQGVASKSIGQCSWNRGWIESCFGAEMARSVASQSILCSGTVAGSMDRVAEYIDLMGGIVSGDPTFRKVPLRETAADGGSRSGVQRMLDLSAKFPSCERNGVDQGVHNVLVHRGALAPVTVWMQQDSPVANLQAQVADVSVTSPPSGGSTYGIRVRSRRGDGAPDALVVHQYDRHPVLQRALFQRYVDWIDTDNFAALWAAEPACQFYDYVDGYDAYAGRCDIAGAAQSGVTSAAQCCSQCEATPDCASFAFALGQCFLKNCRDTDHSQQFSEDLAKARSRSGDAAVQALVLTGRRKVAKT